MKTLKHTETGRKAIVIIHGIGNQQPMATVRNLLYNLIGKNAHFFSSPNRITDDLELRRLSVAGKDTDLYEYYWANLISDPNVYEVFSWIFHILFRKKPSERLKVVIPILRIIIFLLSIAALVLIIHYLNYYSGRIGVFETLVGSVMIIFLIRTFFPTIARVFLTNAIVQYIGDAVRYLTPTPQNIDSRAKIRRGGIELLKKLHEAKSEADETKYRYDKIIVIGHSLGSTIAYNVLSHLWSEYNTLHGNNEGTELLKQDALENIQEYVMNGDIEAEEYQKLQENLLIEQKKIGNPWRISDFITLGSPLTHVSLLIAKDEVDFEKRKIQREFPICPPIVDKFNKGFSYKLNYKVKKSELDNSTIRTLKVLHHAAHFGMTKWTNIYFTNDFVGGSLKKDFGNGILELRLKAKGFFNRVLPMASHTLYWESKQTQSFKKIKEILDIE
jgi:uncharacterized membrane protein